jgi:hypothetical protein
MCDGITHVNGDKTKIVKADPPPSAITCIAVILTICIASTSNIFDKIDDFATIETCAMPLFPELISGSTLGLIRISFSIFILIVTSLRIVSSGKDYQYANVNYLKGSRLRPEPIFIGGKRSMYYFTSWAWILLGISFATSGSLALFVDHRIKEDNAIPFTTPHIKWALRASILLFEISAPVSMLVSVSVRYALWPKALTGNGTANLKLPLILLQHNANVIMALAEVTLLGRLPIHLSDMAVAPIFGIAYVLFAWSWKHKLVPSGRPQFLYFFLDTTLDQKTTISLLVLLAVLILSYLLFMAANNIVLLLDGSIWLNGSILLIVSSLVCRFRD